MKSLINKLKNAKKGMLFFYFISLTSYLICYVLIFKSLLHLEGIETLIRILVLGLFGLFGLIYLIFGFKTLIKKKKIWFTILTIFTIIFAIIFGVSSHYIDFVYQKIENFVTKDTSTYTTVLIGLKGTTLTNDSKIGMITDETDRTGYILPLEFMKKENMKQEISYYGNYTELLEALYNKEVDAIFITKDYPILYRNEEKYQNIASETEILKEYSKEMKTEESELLASTKSLTEPFTVLFLGVDSESKDGLDANAAFNGDTLMLVTFNPKTLTATMLSFPRDTYVPIYSSSDRMLYQNKINASAAYGTASTVNTIEHLTGINIDYFVKVNFQGVIDLVNTLGGIDVDVEQPTYSYYVSIYGEGRLCESNSLRSTLPTDLVCMNTGMQHLNGEQALAYSRNRYGFINGDLDRNRHQQQVIEAVAKQLMKSSNLSTFESLLDTISKNIATNMKTNQILSFYQSIKGMLGKALNGEDFISIQKLALQTFYFTSPYGLSCVGYYQGSLDTVVEAMKENLGLIDIETVKTFSYDYSEDYEITSEIIGTGIYSGGKVPDSSITDTKVPEPSDNENNNDDDNTEDTPNDNDNDNTNNDNNPEEGKDDNTDNGNDNNTTTDNKENTKEPETSTDKEEKKDENIVPGTPTTEETEEGL